MISRGAEPNNLLAWKSEQKREKRLAIHCLSIDTVGGAILLTCTRF